MTLLPLLMSKTRIRPHVAAVALLLALLPGALHAQRVAWQIPERGAALYERTAEFLPAGKPAPIGFNYIWLPAILLQGELDPRQQFVARPPGLLRNLPSFVAFDLRWAAGKRRFELTIPQLMPFGSIHLKGTTSAVDDSGKQIVRATVESDEPIRGPLPNPIYKGYYVGRSVWRVRGELKITRELDIERGLVTGYTAEFHCKFEHKRDEQEKKDRSQQLTFKEQLRLKKVVPNRYPGFTSEVARAIEKGAEHIRKEIEATDRGNVDGKSHNGLTFGSGRLALCLLTLLKAGRPASDPVVKNGFDELRRRVITGSYAVAATLMAFEALYAPMDERRMLIEGRIKKPIQRKPTPVDLELMRGWTKTLLSYYDTRIQQRAYRLRFDYKGGARRYDNSNTQYVVLGLYSASLCGIEISPTVWTACASHWLDCQYPIKSLREPLRLVSHKEFARMRADAAADLAGAVPNASRTVVSWRKVPVAGWQYIGPINTDLAAGRALTASMTCAGITGVTICSAALQNLGTGGATVSKLQMSARQGFAWLHHYFNVRYNTPEGGWYFYYMYGLERAGEMARVALIGDRDWYFEGALMLLGLQSDNGNFRSSLEACCFAVLFLKQAAPPLPVFTGRVP